MSLEYYAGDERPAWVATITVNGAADDYSTGFTFQVKVITGATVVLTKTAGITGAAGGVVTVQWAPNDLALAPGLYMCQLKITRTGDSYEHTISERLQILTRH